MTALSVPTEFNSQVSSATDLSDKVKANTGSSSGVTQGLTYKSFSFSKGFSNTLNKNAYTPDPAIIDSLANNLNDIADGFVINQLNEAGEKTKSFNFSLLPAIESSVGGRQVPEIKPGILKRSSVNIKTFNLPGGAPAFQSLGLEPTMLQLVGLLVGSESVYETESSNAKLTKTSKGVLPIYTPTSTLNAYQSAMYFEQQLVQNNRPVEISISANNSNSGMSNFDPTLTIVYKALIQNVRYFIARQDRIYYSIDALLLDYPNIKSLANDEAPSTTLSSNSNQTSTAPILSSEGPPENEDESTTGLIVPDPSEHYTSPYEKDVENSLPGPLIF